MMRRVRITSCVALPLLLAAYAAAEVSPPTGGEEGFEIERVSWTGNTGEGSVTVINRFGDLRARFGGYEGLVEVFGNVQHFAAEGPRLEVETKESAAGVEVTVGYRIEETGEWVTARDPEHKKRADMVVYVARGVPLSVETDRGVIDVRSLKSDVRARSSEGGITARKVVGALDFATGGGDVLVLLEQWDSERRHSFATETGDLSIYFGGEADAAIRAATSGLLSTDISLEVDYQADRQPIKRAEGMLGKGSSEVAVSSRDGHVRLIRRPLARKARVRPRTGG